MDRTRIQAPLWSRLRLASTPTRRRSRYRSAGSPERRCEEAPGRGCDRGPFRLPRDRLAARYPSPSGLLATSRLLATGRLLPHGLLAAASLLAPGLLASRLLPGGLLPTNLLPRCLLTGGLLASRLLAPSLLAAGLLPGCLLARRLLTCGLLTRRLLASCHSLHPPIDFEERASWFDHRDTRPRQPHLRLSRSPSDLASSGAARLELASTNNPLQHALD